MNKASMLLALPGFLFALPAMAHSGHTSASLMTGFIHPFTGLDHLAALLMIGVFLSQSPRKQALRGFALAIVAFASAVLAGANWPAWATVAEVVSLGSVVVFILLAVKKLPATGVILGVVSFAMAGHGIAHGAELATASAASFSASLAYTLGASLAATLIAATAAGAAKVYRIRFTPMRS